MPQLKTTPQPQFTGPKGQEHMPFLLTPGPFTTSQGSSRRCWRTGVRATSGSARWSRISASGLCSVSPAAMLPMSASSCRAPARSRSRRRWEPLPEHERQDAGRRERRLWGTRRRYPEEAWAAHGCKIIKSDSEAPTAEEVAPALDADKVITHVWVIHCETTSGVVNPIQEIAKAAKGARQDRRWWMPCPPSAPFPSPWSSGHRCHGVFIQQVHRGRSRLLLCACASATCYRVERPDHIPSFSISMSSGRAGEDRPVPVHAADTCIGRLSPGDQGTCAAGRRCSARCPLSSQRASADRGMRAMGFETLLSDKTRAR